MIEVQSLRRSFGRTLAVDGVDLVAQPGEVFGLLGPNGAGKSTTLACIGGLLEPDSGTVRVLGHDVVRERTESRRRMGVVPQDLALYEDLSARENLEFWGAAYGLRGAPLRERVDAVLEGIGLRDRDREPVGRFSGGMKRRLNFGCAIVHRPAVLLVDEPTVGVDPQSRVKLLALVRDQVAEGCTVLYTTHYMEEASELCDRLAIVDHGKVLASGTLAELRGRVGERDVVRLDGRFAEDGVQRAMVELPEVELVHRDDTHLLLSLEDAPRRLGALLSAFDRAGLEVRETTVSRPDLESLFIRLTGHELRE